MKLLLTLVLVACSSPPPPSTPGSGSPAVSAPALDAAPKPEPKPYTGPPERGPCTDVHGCKLRSNCGCSCEGVALSAPSRVACDKSCPNENICDGYSLICDLATQTCGAIPKSP